MTLVYAVVIALAVLVLLLGALVVGLLKGHAEVLRRLDTLGVRLDDAPADQPAPVTRRSRVTTGKVDRIVGVSSGGEPVILDLTSGRDPVLLAFLSTSCSSCTMFWEGFDAPSQTLGSTRYRTVVVTLGAAEESPTRAERLRRGSADVVMSSEAWNDFEVPGAPYFAVVDPSSGTILGEGTSSTIESLTAFLEDSAGDRNWDAKYADRSDRDRSSRIDAELRQAGIEPGDERLYPAPGEISDG